MKLLLNENIYGIEGYDDSRNPVRRLHADRGDILPVILRNPTHFICDSKYYSGNHIIVFPSQVSEVLKEPLTVQDDYYDIEKYHNTYEDVTTKIDLKNDLPYSTLLSDEELMD